MLRHYGHPYRPDGKLVESALYQERDDTRSDREILAEALESTAQNAMRHEQTALREFSDTFTGSK